MNWSSLEDDGEPINGFQKWQIQGIETSIYPVFPPQLIPLVNKQIVAMRKFPFKEEFQLMN